MVLLQRLQKHPLAAMRDSLAILQAWQRPRFVFALSACIVVASLLLGGGTRGGFLSDVILQLLAIPALLAALASLMSLPAQSRRRAKWALVLCSTIPLVPILQLVPLPPRLWTALPHRDAIKAVFDLLQRKAPWFPISVAPEDTWLSALSLLPPLAIFLGTIQLNYRERRLMSLVVLGAGVAAAVFGLIQVAQGPFSPLRFFTVTSDVAAVGFFANPNHFAAQLYALFPFAAAWATEMAFTIRPWRDRKRLETASVLGLTAIFLVLVVLIGAGILTRSRAGLALMIVAGFSALALPMLDRRRPSRLTVGKLMSALTLAVVLLVVQFGLYRVYERFAVDPMQDARLVFARNTASAAKAYMPFGSGVGTFVHVYPTFETPQDTIANVYANHAHDDWLEMWLEGGLESLLLTAAFVAWFALRSMNIWRRRLDEAEPVDLLLARAATMVVPLLMAHSLVDYPLRTGAIMALFALSCAFLVEPLVSGGKQRTSSDAEERGIEGPKTPLRPAPPAEGTPERAAAGAGPSPGQRWGAGVDWPDAWRR